MIENIEKYLKRPALPGVSDARVQVLKIRKL